jgi:hypothetical protein
MSVSVREDVRAEALPLEQLTGIHRSLAKKS